ncbi:MAG TPA: hypothetical protein VLN41_01050 [Candidatus Bathyarchaeia archaeon]|nr:hypothetical protein [Candidatus Bathyarchaeia archaeon]
MTFRPRALRAAALAALALALAAASPVYGQISPEVRAKAAALFDALARIESEAERPTATRIAPQTPAPPAPGSRSLVFSEEELNAYAACRLENEPYVKSAVLKLLAGNKVEGRIGIDLGRPQASGLVPQKQDLLFAARFETRDGRIRIDMDKIYLGTQPIEPAFVDIVIGIVSRLQGVPATTLKDWYDLPRGVQRLETRSGQVVVIY